MEMLEYYDENNQECIGTAERDYIHKNNLWHREVAVWILNDKNELLLQRRSGKKKQNANKFSITAGHIEIKENEKVAALREVKEEIGLDFDENDLKIIDVFKNEQIGNNCFSYTYLIKTNKKIDDMTIQEDEVSELKFISIEELEYKIKNGDDEIPLVKKVLTKLTIEKIKRDFINDDKKIVGIIPARYESTRLPGKPILNICGKPMIWWVYNEAVRVNELSEVYIATDDERIAKVCEKYNMKYIMTSREHKNGTERAIEVSKYIKADYYLVIMGDEPLLKSNDIKEFLNEITLEECDAYMLSTKIKNPVDVVNDTTIKLAINNKNRVIFMSRAEIPYPKERVDFDYYKNIGLYIFSKEVFEFYSNTPMGTLESIEGIEMLRLLENGKKVKAKLIEENILSVDTPKDLKRINEIINERNKKRNC